MLNNGQWSMVNEAIAGAQYYTARSTVSNSSPKMSLKILQYNLNFPSFALDLSCTDYAAKKKTKKNTHTHWTRGAAS